MNSFNKQADRTSASSKKKKRRRRLSVANAVQAVKAKIAGTPLHEGEVTIDPDFSEFECQNVRFRPEALDQLIRCTKFSKKELKIMYRGFKQGCPAGIVDEDTFKGIYAQFFPLGADSSHYAHYVFNTFDSDRSGSISFKEFVVGLSVLVRGTDLEKLQWAFSLYDINGDGFITKEEMTNIVTAIYRMMGRYADPIVDDDAPRIHVDNIFQKMDHNGDGVISLEEFMDTCRNDEAMCQSIAMFDTVF